MSDIVVTVPKAFRLPGGNKVGLQAWISEGDPAGSEWSGTRWIFSTGPTRPDIQIGERVYVVCQGKLRGYAPLLDLVQDQNKPSRYGLIRGGEAVAVTIPETISGFMGWRRRWWERAIEVPFLNWMKP